jgi:hypothetical protein
MGRSFDAGITLLKSDEGEVVTDLNQTGPCLTLR